MQNTIRAASPPHLVVATVAAQEIRVGNRIEFSNVVSLNAAIVQKILTRLQGATKDISALQTQTQNGINGVKNDITAVQDDISDVKTDMGTMAGNIGSLQTDVGNVSTRLGDAEAAITEIRNLVLNLDLANFVDLTARVVAAENAIVNINESLQVLSEEITSVTELLATSIVVFQE
jgi:predicted  nucleic acid-binding Zn-ribbon protein